MSDMSHANNYQSSPTGHSHDSANGNQLINF